MDFEIYRIRKGEKTIEPIGIPLCEDWVAVREAYRSRGRSKNEQLIVMFDGKIYAVERADGDGFAMVHQDRQNSEDDYWYPRTK